MALQSGSESGGGTVVVLDQSRAAAALPARWGASRVPCPSEVGHSVPVGPRHVAVDVGLLAAALAHLAGNDRQLCGQRRDRRIPTCFCFTPSEVVGVETDYQLVVGVGRLEGEPLAVG